MDWMLTILDLDTAVEQLAELLDVPPNQRRVEWVIKVCILTRHIHINIWGDNPDPEAMRKILDLLNSAKEGMSDVPTNTQLTDDDQREIAKHAANVEARIKNLTRNYLERNPSEFAPDDPNP
ncbi:MAG: hypothetical protein ACYS9T_01755 [Planctomycetota bacterium]|jgi:hypothetical protein